MLATLLAMGKDITYIRQLFEGWAPRIFNKNDANYGIFDHVFDARVLRGLIQAEVFDKPLRSDDIKTGLCIISKRADTASVWPVINNPFDQYFAPRAAQGNAPARLGNGDYKLVDLLRASTAARLASRFRRQSAPLRIERSQKTVKFLLLRNSTTLIAKGVSSRA
jgi:hypothetical protein